MIIALSYARRIPPEGPRGDLSDLRWRPRLPLRLRPDEALPLAAGVGAFRGWQ